MLLDKIRITNVTNKATQSPKKHSFYKGYALFVTKTLRTPLFQRFLRWLLIKENIDKRLIEEVQIRVYPFQKKNGNNLAGKWNQRGNISIFPKSYEFYGKLKARHGNKIAHSYVKCRARATLIHEILHAKYFSDEERVRRLTKRYFTLYAKNPKTEELKSIVSTILFKQ
ncbi:MAG: hypothetical protein JSW72_04405 [Candidatus Bathyarchaeota archaeon]|nr:MAG: hypothetical protein JSW72_04405 [Candidatus Bathyarchaeota archaeon]